MVEQYQLHTLLYNIVFNKVWNDWRELQHLISRGNEFQRVGAVTENELKLVRLSILAIGSKM